MVVEKILAALGLIAAVALLIHMALPRRWQLRLEALARDPLRRKARAQAQAQAVEAIQRARRPARGRWKGNVYKLGDQRKSDGDEGGDDSEGGSGDSAGSGPDRRTLH
ncbi:hypothetical protein ACFJGW_08425 [Burkholderiaceae bacterium UC74_6]